MLPEINPEVTRRLERYKTIDDFRNDVSCNLNQICKLFSWPKCGSYTQCMVLFFNSL